jgi:hypothetical protein
MAARQFAEAHTWDRAADATEAQLRELAGVR